MTTDTAIAPEEELAFEETAPKVREPKINPAAKKQPDGKLLVKIFAGHEDFLGYTPD
jgi:hypothetical protein